MTKVLVFAAIAVVVVFAALFIRGYVITLSTQSRVTQALRDGLPEEARKLERKSADKTIRAEDIKAWLEELAKNENAKVVSIDLVTQPLEMRTKETREEGIVITQCELVNTPPLFDRMSITEQAALPSFVTRCNIPKFVLGVRAKMKVTAMFANKKFDVERATYAWSFAD